MNQASEVEQASSWDDEASTGSQEDDNKKPADSEDRSGAGTGYCGGCSSSSSEDDVDSTEKKPATVVAGTASQKTPFQRRQFMRQLTEVIETFPEEEKAAYKDAKRLAPQLVNQAQLVRLFSNDKLDIKTAATKLLLHWKMRKELFGKRAFRYLNMTGSGALEKADIEELRSGFLRLLPPVSIQGRKIHVLLDDMTGEHAMSNEALLRRERCRFYMLASASERSVQEPEGGLAVILFSSSAQLDLSKFNRFYNLLETVPASIQRLHLCLLLPPDKESSPLRASCQAMIRESLQQVTKIYEAVSVTQLATKLAAEGLTVDDLPETMGGAETDEQFRDWMAQQVKMEQQLQIQATVDANLASKRDEMHRSEKRELEEEERNEQETETLKKERDEFRALQDKFLSLSATRLWLGEEQKFLETCLVHVRQLVGQGASAQAAATVEAAPASQPLDLASMLPQESSFLTMPPLPPVISSAAESAAAATSTSTEQVALLLLLLLLSTQQNPTMPTPPAPQTVVIGNDTRVDVSSLSEMDLQVLRTALDQLLQALNELSGDAHPPTKTS